MEPTALIENFEKLLATGRDGAPLRFGLGNAYLTTGQAGKAVEHLKEAVRLDPAYSAAWKLLGKALTEAGQPSQAAEAYQQGIEAARRKGDVQAQKEMTVFLKRLSKARENPS